MSHLDPEVLALLALGEPAANAKERTHLASCPVCASEVVDMRHAVAVARTTIDGAELEEPPPGVWNRVRLDLGLQPGLQPGLDPGRDPGAGLDAEPGGDPGGVAISRGRAVAAEVAPPLDAPVLSLAPTGEVRTTTPPRQPRASWIIAASLVLLGAGAAGVGIGVATTLAPASIAVASLEPFPAHPGATGHAEVDEARDGSRTLTVALQGDLEGEGVREVWLLREDGADLVSLGALDGSTTTFSVPPDIDLGTFDLVDVSLEPVDGDAAHSGDSIVRGRLT